MADGWWDSRARPCMDPVSITSMNLFQETTESTTTTTTSGGGGAGGDRGGDGVLSNNPSLQMMELGLSSQPISQPLDWNQTSYRGDQGNCDQQSGYQTLIQEDNSLSSNTSIFQETLWKSQHKMYSETPSEFKQINVRGFRLDEPVHYNDEQGLNPSFQTMDHSYGSNSTIIQSLFGTDSNTNQQDSGYDQNQGMSYSYQSGYGGITMSGGSGSSGGEYPPPPHAPQEFLGNSPPKVQQPSIATQLQFSNNARFWNASAAPMNDVRSTFFPLQAPPPSLIEDKPKNPISEMVKKSNTKSSSTKRPRNENPPLPAFKVRKEKMGDRITALQQLVSPFGKTDTASVLSEAIEYIKFLHEQVNVLSTPYLKNAAIMQQMQQQIADKPPEGSGQDLRSRGLCLVPISSTFPVTHETTVDFWTPSFGGTFR